MLGGSLRKAQRAGRNERCPCGSGKKYKRCCLEQDLATVRKARAALPEVMEIFAQNAVRQERVERTLRERYGIYVNYVAPAHFQGRKVWAIGSRLYPDRPENETFVEFIIAVLGGTLGEEWMRDQEARPEQEQHLVRRCYSKHIEWRQRHTEVQEDGLFAGEPDGWTQYLVGLAFDVASLIHAGNLPESLVRRLRNPDQYQGARYEVAVAAIFARLGCEIEFLIDEEHPEKHPEFIARRADLGLEVAVEAKSRHRPGVIHMPGEHNDEGAQRGDVQRLYRNALEKTPSDGRPFMIFIDVNAPPTPDIPAFERQWQKDVRDWLPAGDPEERSYQALCITNYSPHYKEDDLASSGEFFFVESIFVRDQIPADFRTMLLTALETCGRVPEIKEDGDLRDD